jgi:predicted PhzF superfamily epimerase YddE/YHI9
MANWTMPLFIVDAFTEQPFAGNPAAVCLLDSPRPAAWMQQVAAEMNLSETAFLLQEGDGYRLRWFTPAVEVDLCGHATLASAHILREQAGKGGSSSAFHFHTRSGLLRAEFCDGRIELDFPALITRPCAPPPGLAESLGTAPTYIASYGMDYLCEMPGESVVRGLKPDLDRLRAVPTRGVVVTSRADDPRYDFVSRFFAPAVGIAEDPVTGSAHCALGPYWAAKLGKTDLVGYQASRRGGVVSVRVENERVRLGGHAVTVVRGELSIGATLEGGH